MNAGKSIFSQVMSFMPLNRFHTCVNRYNGNSRFKKFPCLDQFKVMAFAQLTYRRSLRDTVACLRAMKAQLYHSGIRHAVPKSTLADANESRDWRIFADFAQVLIDKARRLYADEDFGDELKKFTLYALDSTMIDLCLSVFPWSPYQQSKAAVKLHTLLDLRGNIPSFIDITDGKTHDVNALDLLPHEPGAFYIMDRGYIDFQRLYALKECLAYFVIRAKTNMKFQRRYSREIDKASGLRCDQTIKLTGAYSIKDYPEALRRIKYYDKEHDRHFVFLTNNFDLPALTITELYKLRWQIELFFKWIKQHLRIKSFFGTSENAVKTQVWIAASTYLLVAILKKELGVEQSLYEILQIFSITPFHKTPINTLFSSPEVKENKGDLCKQLSLWDF